VRGKILLLRIFVWSLVSSTALAGPNDDIKSLVEKGNFAEAYAQGKSQSEHFGDPAFDFFFGIAAIDTNHAGEGVLALERYLLNFPDNVSARLQLARGYFLLGEDARAREEFEALRQLKPPADITATIDRFLESIRLRETRYTTSAGGYVEFGIGNDTNVNGGVANSNIFLGNLGPVLIAQNGQKINDNFASLGAGGYISYPVAPGIALFGNGQAEQKQLSNNDNRQFQLGNLDATGGVSVLREKNLYKFSISQGYVTLGNRTFRSATGGSVEMKHQLDEFQSFSVGAQGAQLRYTDPNSPRDADFWGLNTTYRHQFTHPWQPVMTLGANYGEQHSTQSRPDLAPHTWGANAGVSFTPEAKWGVSLDFTYLQSDYRGRDAFIGDTRHDKYYAYSGVLSYLYSRNVSFRAELLNVNNVSNIELYSFPRQVITFKMRYEFK
jgi:hypothetical protein